MFFDMAEKKKLVLVDGSGYLFRAFYAVPPLTAPDGRPTGVIYGVINMLRRLLKEEKPDNFLVVFDAKGETFRHRMYPQYKANRPPNPKELQVQVQPLLELVMKLGYPMLQVEDFEADDVIGTLAVSAPEKNYKVIVATCDKDFAQIVTEDIILFDPMKRQFLRRESVKEKMGIFPEQVVDYLALMGDKSDNVPGVEGVGPKTAIRWLKEYSTLEQLLEHAEKIKGKVGEKLRASRKDLALYRKLVTINRAVPLNVGISDLKMSAPDLPALHEIYAALGFRSLLNEIENLSAEGESAPQQPEGADYQLILDDKVFREWLDRLKATELFAFDIETVGDNYMQAEIVGMAFATTPKVAAYLPVAHDYGGMPVQLSREKTLDALRDLLQDEQAKKVGHHLQYARNVLFHHGINLRGVVHDIMLQSYVLNSATGNHDLISLCRQHLSCYPPVWEEIEKSMKKQPISQMDVAAICRYSAGKTSVYISLYQTLNKKLKLCERLLKFYQETELPMLYVLSDIERKGVCLDTNLLTKQDKHLTERIRQIKRQIYAVSGYEFNLDSPTQIRQILFIDQGLPVIKKTKKGEPSTDEEVLNQLAETYRFPQLILRYRSLSKLQSTYTRKLPQAVNPITQRIHTSYHQAVTVTGRLSSSSPNLQNIPIRTVEGRQIRKAFVAAEGYSQIAADYSQIELRLMAHISQDKNLCAAFHHGDDVHKLTASEVFGIPIQQVTETERRDAKAINFGLIYGMQAFGLAKQLGVSRVQAKEYLEAYFERYPKVRQYMSDIKESARRKGYVETLFGRRLYLPAMKSRHAPTRQYAERTAINAPMQGSAADIIKRAMVGLYRRFDEMRIDAAIIMQVHDELIIEAKESDADDIVMECRRIMSTAAHLIVPLEVDIGVGANWDEAH